MSLALTTTSIFRFCFLWLLFHLIFATEECSLYIAPSSRSTEDTFHLGVFAGIDFQPGDRIGPSDIAIPIIDLEFHNSHRLSPSSSEKEEVGMEDDDDDDDPNIFDSIVELLWKSQNTGAKMEIYSDSKTKGSSVLVSIPGVGAMARDSSEIVNADFNEAWILNRTLTLSDETSMQDSAVPHPGRGAYTSYSPIVFEATQFIPVGSEIFINYGKNYDDNAINYEKVDKTLQKINTFFTNHEDELTPSQKQSLYSFFVEHVIPYSGRKTGEYKSGFIQAFPKKVDNLSSIVQGGGSFIYHNPQAMKTISWLQTHGQCMDGLYPGISSIPHAGRGAFAKRDIPKGQIISPMPLLKIDDQSWLDIYPRVDASTDEGEVYSVREDDDVDDPSVKHKQLILNYCYGHPSSSIVFHPVGSVINLINHKPIGQGANCKIVWSNHSMYNQDWQYKSVDELKELNGYGIAFDLVATRDIQAHEEVFLDYGTEWERAWMEHLESWSYDDSLWPSKADDWNHHHTHDTFFTVDERGEIMSTSGSDPYPTNIETVCQVVWNEVEQSDGNKILTFDSNVKYKNLWTGDNMFRCDIIERDVVEGGDLDNVDDYFYTVVLRPSGETIEKIPHKCIRFHDKAYTTDMHNPVSFRHPIGIPDSIFPDAWKNLDL